MANTCNCPTPPGGFVICENDQVAICIVRNGETISRCINLPHRNAWSRYKDVDLVNWALEQITDFHRNKDQKITRSDIKMLRSGKYSQIANVSEYTFTALFTLPRQIKIAIDNLDRTNPTDEGDILRF